MTTRPGTCDAAVMWTPTRVATALITGGAGGLLLDQIHVRYGVLHYPKPWLWGQAWWVAPLFAVATIVILSAARLFTDGAPGTREHQVAGSAGWFVAAYWASGQWHAHPIGLSVAYAVFFALRTTHRPTLIFAGLLAAGGVTFEAALSSTGAFAYRHPDFFGVPMWLAGLYLHGAPLALAISARLRPRTSG
jgi:hypothetical protein